jgi:hypothetical protein
LPNPYPAILHNPTGDAAIRHASTLPAVARILEEEGIPYVPTAPGRDGERLAVFFGGPDHSQLHLRWSHHDDAEDPGETVFQLSCSGLQGSTWDASYSAVPCGEWDRRMPRRTTGTWLANPMSHELFRALDANEPWQEIFRAIAAAYRG